MLMLANEDAEGTEFASTIDEICRQGAERMLAAALIREADRYVEALTGEVDEEGRRLVVRNGYHRQRKVTTAAGAIEIKAPRVNDRRTDPATGERIRFSSAIVPPWCRKSPKVVELLPLLYLHGLSTGDFVAALEDFLGSAHGLSASAISRLVTVWESEYQKFRQRQLTDTDYVYVWIDGIHFNVRLEDERLCALVMIGVRTDGTKELVAIEDGYRESTDSWADLLRDAKRRGMAAPVVAIGDGALGFWGAVRDVWPETKEQRDWVHKVSNVLSALPKSAHRSAKAALAAIRDAEDKEHAVVAAKEFEASFGAKFPKAVAKITKDLDKLLTFYDFPAEHWVHLKTTNPIESTFATVRLRTKVTKGPGSRAAGIAMAYKLVEAAQGRWRRINGPELVALVRAGAIFEKGVLAERYNPEVAA